MVILHGINKIGGFMKNKNLSPAEQIGNELSRMTRAELRKTDVENAGKCLQTAGNIIGAVGTVAVAVGTVVINIIEAMGGGGRKR